MPTSVSMVMRPAWLLWLWVGSCLGFWFRVLVQGVGFWIRGSGFRVRFWVGSGCRAICLVVSQLSPV